MFATTLQDRTELATESVRRQVCAGYARLSGTDGGRTEARLGLAAQITHKGMPIPERTGQSENRMDAAFDLSLRVRGTQAGSNETSQTRGAEESAPVVTAKKSANFAAHEVHRSVAHKGSARWAS